LVGGLRYPAPFLWVFFMKYYLHDTSAFDDEKVSELYIRFGYEGVGLFYVILEKIGKQEKPVKTSVLKSQLKVGKRLEKVWSFMEEIGIISSNNGETFNKQLLNFSEKYKIKKEKTREKVLEWRKNQQNAENVTGYVPICNHPKVKESKVKENKDSDKDDQSLTTLPTQPKKNNGKSLKETFETREREFKESLFPFVGTYEKDLVKAFFEHWSEPDKVGKMLFEKQKTWETGRRLSKWKRNEEKFKSERKTKTGLNTPDGLMNIEIDY
jgi:hypothetical protein